MTFDLSKPGVGVTRSPMGGGWVWPLNKDGRHALRSFFEEDPAPIPVTVMNGDGELSCVGYVVEPWQSAELADHLRASGVAWTVR
jgi:hypothetical protein